MIHNKSWLRIARPSIVTLMILSGSGILALVLFGSYSEKIAIVADTIGLFMMLIGIHLLGGDRSFSLTLPWHWVCYLPLAIGVLGNLLSVSSYVRPEASVVVLALALSSLLPLSKATNVSKTYIAFLTVFLVGSIAYDAFVAYPLVFANDPLGSMAVASAIVQTGTYSHIVQPTDSYYFAFPVMSIAPAIFSLISGLDVQRSILIFPGSLILLQSLFVFSLARVRFESVESAALAALVLVTQPVVNQWISAPIAQSTAISLLLIILTILYSHERSRGHVLLILTMLLMVVAIHGAVGLLSVVLILYLVNTEKRSYRRIIQPLGLIAIGYVVIAGAVYALLTHVNFDIVRILQVSVEASSGGGGKEVYGLGSNGLTFISWGLPVSLGLLLILVDRKRSGYWAFAGLSLLGVSFAVNLIAPTLTIDRYVGLCAWFILAVCGGRGLSILTRSYRQLFAVALILFLVSMSGIMNPYVSPQYGLKGFQGVFPTTNGDRTALEWANSHLNGRIFADSISRSYLIYIRYRSGIFNYQGLTTFPPPLQAVILPEARGDVTVIRWSDVSRGTSCYGLTSASLNNGDKLSILFNNSCTIMVTRSAR